MMHCVYIAAQDVLAASSVVMSRILESRLERLQPPQRSKLRLYQQCRHNPWSELSSELS